MVDGQLAATINAVARQARDASVPVLIPDTCALLDLVRVTERAQSVGAVTNTLRPATEVLRRAKMNPPTVLVVLPVIVHEEYARNLDGAHNTVADRWPETVRRLANLHQAAAELGVARRPAAYDNDTFQPILAACQSLADDIQSASVTLRDDTDCGIRATRRNRDRRPPSLRGDQSADCTIIEHAMEFARQVSSTAGQIVFLSSNKKDYYPDGDVVESLATEMREAGLAFSGNWRWAARELGLHTR